MLLQVLPTIITLPVLSITVPFVVSETEQPLQPKLFSKQLTAKLIIIVF